MHTFVISAYICALIMSRNGDETEVEERVVYDEKEMISVLHRLKAAEETLAEVRAKNAELRAINDAYAKRLEEAERKLPEYGDISAIAHEKSDDEEEKKDAEFQAKTKRCGKCKKSGHNARTCKT